jgi:hypothetical protein
MLFTRDELVEMGLLSPVATPRLPDCQKVVSSDEQVATDLTPLFIYIYFSRLLGCKNILEVEGEINEKYRVKTIVSPCNLATERMLDFFVSQWHRYGCDDLASVATSGGTLQPENIDAVVEATRGTYLHDVLSADWDYFKRYKQPPGDAWDGVLPDDGPDLSQFNATEARLIPSHEVLESAVVERQTVKAGKTMLSLMYEHNVDDYTWFEGTDGLWHCYNHQRMQ